MKADEAQRKAFADAVAAFKLEVTFGNEALHALAFKQGRLYEKARHNMKPVDDEEEFKQPHVRE